MQFKVWLELFETPKAIDWHKRGETWWGDFTVTLPPNKITSWNANSSPEIRYELAIGGRNGQAEVSFSSGDSYNYSYGITNTGNELLVFSTVVIAGIKEYIEAHHPWQLKFSAHEPSRQKLYKAFIQRFLRPLGWTSSFGTTEFVVENDAIRKQYYEAPQVAPGKIWSDD